MASPVHTFTEMYTQAAIWKNKKSDGTHYYTVSFSRRFKATDGDTKYATSFGLYDLSHLVTVAGKSIAWMWRQSLKERGHKVEEPKDAAA